MKNFISSIQKEYNSYSKEKKQFFNFSFGALAILTLANYAYEAGVSVGKMFYHLVN